MTPVAKRAHNVRMSRRPKEWATWQGRLAWMVDQVVPGQMTLRELARVAQLGAEGGLSLQMTRLRNGSGMQFSTVIGLQRALGCSWEWLAEGKGWPTEEIRRRMGGSAPPMRAV